jgi:hypothetical protein
MKTITISPQSAEINALLEQARHEDLLVQSADGSEYLLVAIEEFDEEIARTRQNARLMALLDERAKQSQTIPLAEAKRQLGLTD